jgi:phenylalanyl-tRNA synthetase beta chain
VAGDFSGVVVGEILACEKHPDANKLSVCQVDDGSGEPLQVVCGAPNARAGLKMPFARVGAKLGEDFEIGKANLRGVESFGMACSGRELGLSEDHSGLMELPVDAVTGEDFRAWLGLDDQVIDLELTPNRADCLGILGLARDVSAILGTNYTPLDIEPVAPVIEDCFDVELIDAEDCPRFGARIIRGIDPTAPTPLWMVEALRRSGIRSISAVVDCTNYVLMELGQPMHAYDLDTLKGGITVRRGKPGETLVLLDEKEIELDGKLLAICDASGPVGLGGIMGGLGTGVTDSTTNVLLEAAWFRPATIMGRARELGMHTDASHRFERGVDPQGQERAIERITGLLLDICGGQAGPLKITEVPDLVPANQPVLLRIARLNRVLGTDISTAEVRDILDSLGMAVSETDGGWQVTGPSSRFDIEIEEDLIEEVARIYGYNRLPATPPAGELQLGAVSEREVALNPIRENLFARGYQEALTYAFVDRKLLETLHMEEGALPLANPISSDMDVMRTALLPGLLTALARNLRRQQNRVRLFETGKVFIQQETLHEIERGGAVVCGTALPEQWNEQKRGVDFYDLKGDAEALLALRGIEGQMVEFLPTERPWLHPGQAAELLIDGEVSGWLGQVHPAVLAALDIKLPVFAFEFDLERINKREIPSTNNISQFPSVRRDLAFLVPESVNYNEIKALVTELAGQLLAKLVLFDQFSGQSVETGYKSLAIGLILQDVSCTLTDEVVDSLVDGVINELQSKLDAQLRG